MGSRQRLILSLRIFYRGLGLEPSHLCWRCFQLPAITSITQYPRISILMGTGVNGSAVNKTSASSQRETRHTECTYDTHIKGAEIKRLTVYLSGIYSSGVITILVYCLPPSICKSVSIVFLSFLPPSLLPSAFSTSLSPLPPSPLSPSLSLPPPPPPPLPLPPSPSLPLPPSLFPPLSRRSLVYRQSIDPHARRNINNK